MDITGYSVTYGDTEDYFTSRFWYASQLNPRTSYVFEVAAVYIDSNVTLTGPVASMEITTTTYPGINLLF